MNYKDNIDNNRIPRHIAVIMDGNGRWAKEKGKNRIFGHRNGVKAVRETTETCARIGVKFLTLYAFSTENWERPAMEVNALMELLVYTLRKETKQLNKNNIRLNAIGNIQSLPKRCYEELLSAIDITKNNDRMTLTLALSYSARWELTEALKKIAQEIVEKKRQPQEIDENLIGQYLTTKNMPDPELLIRTSGEQRVSNYLLWQIAYSEFYFTDTFWPDFNENELYKAIYTYQQRDRRFGKLNP